MKFSKVILIFQINVMFLLSQMYIVLKFLNTYTIFVYRIIFTLFLIEYNSFVNADAKEEISFSLTKVMKCDELNYNVFTHVTQHVVSSVEL